MLQPVLQLQPCAEGLLSSAEIKAGSLRVQIEETPPLLIRTTSDNPACCLVRSTSGELCCASYFLDMRHFSSAMHTTNPL